MTDGKFFINKNCKYYPCHNMKDINCLFCFCPLYSHDCPGTPLYIKTEKGIIKDCSHCTFPHEKENYEAIIKLLSK